ncbi:MAG: ANTAR domain-containing protein [Gammaproteobacteria bacterium]|jgi:response regulator NasT
MAKKILLVDLTRDADDSFQQAFMDSGYKVVDCESGVESVESYLKPASDINAVVVNVDIPTLQLFKILKHVINQYATPMVMFTGASNRHFAEEAANVGIGAYIVDGFEPGRIQNIMDLAEARSNELRAIKSELARTKLSLDERKIIERAKGILMRRRTLDEESAFQLMRKMAMDKNQRLAEVAKNIVHVDTLFT